MQTDCVRLELLKVKMMEVRLALILNMTEHIYIYKKIIQSAF